MLTDIELIRKFGFFQALDQKILKRIAEMCIVREFSSGEFIVRQGEAGLGLYFITSGSAKIEVARGDVRAVVAELKAGDSVGEFAIIDEQTRSASVICLEETRCLLLTRDSFDKLMRKHPEIANQMLRTLVGRIRNTNERLSVSNQATTAPAAGVAAAAPGAPPTPPQPESATESLNASPEGLLAKLSGLAGFLPPMPGISDIPHPSEVFKFYSATKTKTREYLNEMVGSIYAMKAMMRFSMAIVGCPVRVVPESNNSEVLVAEWNGVKLVLFPAGMDETLRVEAYDDGEMHATIYRPQLDGKSATGAAVEVIHLDGAVERDQVYRLRLRSHTPLEIESAPGMTNGWRIQPSKVL